MPKLKSLYEARTDRSTDDSVSFEYLRKKTSVTIDAKRLTHSN